MWWCTSKSLKKFFFFYWSYFSLPLTHHMTLVEINAFSHHHASLLMSPSPLFPTPMPGMKAGGSRCRWMNKGLEMCLHLEPQVSSYFFILFFFLLCKWIFFYIQLGYMHVNYDNDGEHHQTPRRTGGLKMCLHLEPQVSSFLFHSLFLLCQHLFKKDYN